MKATYIIPATFMDESNNVRKNETLLQLKDKIIKTIKKTSCDNLYIAILEPKNKDQMQLGFYNNAKIVAIVERNGKAAEGDFILDREYSLMKFVDGSINGNSNHTDSDYYSLTDDQECVWGVIRYII